MDKKSSGIGFWGALQLILIVLKLLNLIDWSWKLVLFPLWIDLGILVFVILAYAWSNWGI